MQAYRPDIDGLRAIAVVSVILFHASPTLAISGHLGVDVFFVISGYLIAKLILPEIADGTFSFGGFFLRRIRRLAPAFLAVVLAVLLVGWIVATPQEYLATGRTALASILSVANVQLPLVSDYFAPAMASNPLMHTWSLSVEEQFYLVFPVLAWVTCRGHLDRAVPLATVIVVASFICWLWLGQTESVWQHYSPFARAWQIGAGVLLAAIHLGHSPMPSNRWDGTAAIALCAVVAVMLFDLGELGPVIAVIATLVLIHAGHRPTFLAPRILSQRGIVVVGLASYSLYLWHQPIFAFGRMFWDGDEPRFVVGAIALSVIIGFASWIWIEMPVRRAKVSGKTVSGMFGAVAVPAVAVSAMVIVTNGAADRSNLELALTAEDADLAQRVETCGYWDARSVEDVTLCSFGDQNAETKVAVWGDSLAASLLPGLVGHDKAIGITQAAFHGCPTVGRPTGFEPRLICDQKFRAAEAAILNDDAIDWVIMHGQWKAVDYQGLSELTDRFTQSGKRVLLIEKTPRFARDVGATLDRMNRLGLRSHVAPTEDLDNHLTQTAASREMLAQLAKRDMVDILPILDLVCDQRAGLCRSIDAYGAALYADYNHLSPFGAKVIGGRVLDLLLRPSRVDVSGSLSTSG